MLDIVLLRATGLLDRFARAAATLALLAVFVYAPAGWALGRVASPQRMLTDAGPIQFGDVLLVNRAAYRWSSPAPGDVVLYDIPETRVGGRTHLGFAAILIVRGPRIDRVLATGGQIVDCAGGRCTVNAKPSAWQPFNPGRLACTFKVSVPHGCCLILPSTDRNITDRAVSSVYLVPESQIQGRVYLRTQPLTRFALIR